MDGEAWWAAVHGVAQSWTRLKRLSSSRSTYWAVVEDVGQQCVTAACLSLVHSVLTPSVNLTCVAGLSRRAQPVRSSPGPDQCLVSLSLVTSRRMKVRTRFHSQLPFLPALQDLLSRVVLWVSLVFPR